MKTKVFVLFDKNEKYISVFGTFDQAIDEIKNWIRAEYWNYSSEKISIERDRTDTYQIYTWSVPEHRDDNSRLIISFEIVEWMVETEDF